jgi:hypothetical protein
MKTVFKVTGLQVNVAGAPVVAIGELSIETDSSSEEYIAGLESLTGLYRELLNKLNEPEPDLVVLVKSVVSATTGADAPDASTSDAGEDTAS